MTVPGQSVVSYGYDNANRLTQISQGTTVVTFTYNAAGRRTSLTLPNGVVTQYSHDAASRLVRIVYTKAAVRLGDLSYSYNSMGIITALGGTFSSLALICL